MAHKGDTGTRKSDDAAQGVADAVGRRRRHRLPRWADRLVTLLVILAGALLLVWPWVADRLDSQGVTRQITAVEANVEALPAEEKERYLSQATAFNAVLAGDDAALVATGLSADEVWPYDEQLTYEHDPMMSWVEIPSIDVSMPIYHGTSEDALMAGVGHLEQTSLPVGGASTHCVLTAHSGMRAQRMFDDIRQLRPGDLVLLHTMGETLAYEMTDAETVLPTELDSLSVEQGKDLLTLVTCTPYGVNDHRLLVHCARTSYTTDEVEERTNEQESLAGRHWGAREVAVVVVAVAVAGVVLDTVLHERRLRRRDRGRGQDGKHFRSGPL